MKTVKLNKLTLVLSCAMMLSTIVACSSNSTNKEESNLETSKILEISSLQNQSDVDFDLEILHMNDVHSYMNPVGVSIKTSQGVVRVKVGGVESFSNIIKTRKKENPNLLVISAGDQITGNAANYDIFHGESDAVLHGLYGNDYYVLGNHEFDHGGQGIASFIGFMKKFSPKSVLLNSDLTVGPNSPIKNDNGVVQDFKNISGHEIVFYGVTAGKKITKSSSPDPDMKFKETISAINELSKANKDRAKIQVLVSHQGIISDRINAAKLNDIDIIVGGDSHSLCGDFSKYGLKGECVYPMTLKNASGHKICVVQANEYGKILGDLSVSFDKDGNVLSCKGKPFMPLWVETATLKNSKDATSPENKTKAQKLVQELIDNPNTSFVKAVHDEEVVRTMKPYWDRISRDNKLIGKASQDLCATRYPGDECVINNAPSFGGSEVCQVLGEIFTEHTGKEDSFFLSNSGMFRIDIEAGDFTEADLLGVIPFNNKIIETRLPGKEIIDLLNQVYRYINRDVAARDGGVPCGYGFKYDLDNTQKDNVRNVKVLGKDGKYSSIIPNKEYTVITTDYVMRGKDGYDILKKHNVLQDFGLAPDIVKAYLKKNLTLPKLPKDSTEGSFKKE